MKVITVGNEKGGVGKSTIACNLAVMAARDGKSVLLVDADSQEASMKFRALRKAENDLDDIQAISMAKSETIYQDVQKFSNFDLIIIDSGGRDDIPFRSAILASNGGFLLIPVKLGQYDIWSTRNTLDILKQMRAVGAKINAAFVINQALTSHSTLTLEAKEVLQQLAEEFNVAILESVLYNRVDYSKAITLGQGISEFKAKTKKAANEFAALYAETMTKLEDK